MKQKLFLVILFLSLKSFSQDSKLSLEMHYPLTMGQNFISKNYSGIIDVGGKFRFSELKNINIGASLNGGILSNNTNDNNGDQDFRVKSYLIQPRIFSELKIESVPKIRPFVGIGYTFMVFKATGTNNGFDVSASNSTESVINANFGVAYDITSKIFLDLQFDYVKLNVGNEVPKTAFNTNVNLLKVGLGLRL
ncbi:opacity protein-like surface antigen [Flavobacterium tiangeerense]|uniref:Opacity protein-like surface antigen n=1 Tax=Flavobacterium tiangeerense TaxID=459471 RepID=A0ABY3FM55_9FLAO|nr:OmpW family outer membrane protein [Flavobacterium tiangeerense]TWI01268.1 opacity protein-like surface antigen [Flavobacterium tiangeerense]